MNIRFATVCVLACSAFTIWAKTVYVNCQMPDYDGHDGSTPDLALRTLIEATGPTKDYPHAAESGDTVIVAEGEYDDGASDTWMGAARLFISSGKDLHVKASGRAERTVIVGARAPGAVRCVLVGNAEAAKSVIEGFTLRNGFTGDAWDISAFGGAVCSPADNGYDASPDGPYLVGCTIKGCGTRRRSVLYGGRYVRCRIEDMDLPANGILAQSALLANSVVTHIVSEEADGSRALLYIQSSRLVNVTFADNWAVFYPASYTEFYNILYSASKQPYNHGAAAVWESVANDSAALRALVGPAVGDVRLRGDVADVLVGQASWIGTVCADFPEEVDPYVDAYGTAVPKEGTIAVGAAQTKAVPAAGAVVLDADRLSLKAGRPGLKGSYVHPMAYPVTYRVHTTFATNDPRRVVYYTSACDGLDVTRFPLLADDAVDVIPPPSTGSVLTVGRKDSSAIRHAQPGADGATADGSAENPFPTIQAALESAWAEDPNGAVVCAREGEYSTGETDFAYLGTTSRARVHVPNGRTARILAVDGAARTFLTGSPDPATAASETAPGCGGNAVCALAVNGLCGLQGFTVTGSHSCQGSGYYSTGRGSIFFEPGAGLHVTDCVVSNNVGAYAAVGAGRYERCRIVGNRGRETIMGQKVLLIACVLSDNVLTGSSSRQLVLGAEGGAARLYNCSILGRPDLSAVPSADSSVCVNLAVDDGGLRVTAAGGHHGCVYNGFAEAVEGNFMSASPCFADKSSADLRLSAVSPAVTAGVGPGDPGAGDLFRWATTDIDGAPMAFDAEGRMLPGASARVAEGVYLAAEQGSVAVEGGHWGVNEISTGETISLRAVPGSRPVAGFVVNGVTNLFEDCEGHVIRVTEPGSYRVEALYLGQWYASPTGSVDALGFYPSEALTLKAALERAVAGDSVLALPGTYAGEPMVQPGDCTLRSRAVVPDGVTLSSTGGRRRTVIAGAEATQLDELYQYENTAHGLGEDAIRCVYLGRNAAVRGFTLAGGRTRNWISHGESSYSHADTCGAGVFAAAGATGLVEDCLLTNNVACVGGAVCKARSVRCVMANNQACYSGGAQNGGEMIGCLTYGNEVFYPYIKAYAGVSVSRIDRCSIHDYLNLWADSVCLNSVVYRARLYRASAANVTNSVFASEGLDRAEGAYAGDPAYFQDGCGAFETNAAALACDASYRPIVGANAAIDLGLTPDTQELASCDCLGGQRVYNGLADLGAVEADWRTAYAALISKGNGLTVESATENVVASDRRTVVLNPSSGIRLKWALRPGIERAEIGVRLCGTGVLSVRLPDGTVLYEVEGAVERQLVFTAAQLADGLSLEFMGDGSAEVLNVSAWRGFLLTVR